MSSGILGASSIWCFGGWVRSEGQRVTQFMAKGGGGKIDIGGESSGQMVAKRRIQYNVYAHTVEQIRM